MTFDVVVCPIVAQPDPLSVDDALDRLVNQFADPMAFFRELVQNAVDAGTDAVDIRVGWERGMMIVHVDDSGSGMTREIIETQLTRLFSSSKDGDRTKIGKFGIGFVSVFAIEPQAVCVDTSREGEHWRVLFDERRHFSLIRRTDPVEGTKIQVFKPLGRADYEQFRQRAREVVEHWCKHLRVDIRVDGELINRPFALQVPCVVRLQQDEDEIVVGHPIDGASFAGFYNRGLTLLERTSGEDDSAVVPGIAFKVSSGTLEHTLTRDDIIRERSFDRTMARIRQLAGRPLARVVADELASVLSRVDPAAADPGQAAELEYLWRAQLHHVSASSCDPDAADLPVFRTLAGALVGADDLRRAPSVVVATESSPTVERLTAHGALVVWLPKASEFGPKLVAALARSWSPLDHWCTALPVDETSAATWRPVRDPLERLLRESGFIQGRLELAHIDCTDPAVTARVAIFQREFGQATAVSECTTLDAGRLAGKRVLVINVEHPTIASVAGLAPREPELAAYFAVKAVLLAWRRLDADTDAGLVRVAHELRQQRRGAA